MTEQDLIDRFKIGGDEPSDAETTVWLSAYEHMEEVKRRESDWQLQVLQLEDELRRAKKIPVWMWALFAFTLTWAIAGSTFFIMILYDIKISTLGL